MRYKPGDILEWRYGYEAIEVVDGLDSNEVFDFDGVKMEVVELKHEGTEKYLVKIEKPLGGFMTGIVSGEYVILEGSSCEDDPEYDNDEWQNVYIAREVLYESRAAMMKGRSAKEILLTMLVDKTIDSNQCIACKIPKTGKYGGCGEDCHKCSYDYDIDACHDFELDEELEAVVRERIIAEMEDIFK